MCTFAALVAIAAIAAGSSSAATPKLQALVADPIKITLTVGGKKVSSLKAGTYTIVVKDTSSGHNFRLSGPGVNKTTSVSAKGTFTWKVRLKRGTYKYVCDPHASFMKGSFTVK
jgi:plastocyanin